MCASFDCKKPQPAPLAAEAAAAAAAARTAPPPLPLRMGAPCRSAAPSHHRPSTHALLMDSHCATQSGW